MIRSWFIDANFDYNPRSLSRWLIVSFLLGGGGIMIFDIWYPTSLSTSGCMDWRNPSQLSNFFTDSFIDCLIDIRISLLIVLFLINNWSNSPDIKLDLWEDIHKSILAVSHQSVCLPAGGLSLSSQCCGYRNSYVYRVYSQSTIY